MYKLSKPQKLLYGCGIFMFVILFGGIALTTLTWGQNSATNSSSSSSRAASSSTSSAASSAIKVNCTTGSAEIQVLCYINNYRSVNSLKQLTNSSSLAQVAATHSAYMAAQDQLTDAGFEGATIQESCQTAGTTCKTQIIGFTSTGDYSSIMNDWENSPADNAVLIGNYTQVGISNHAGYITVVLN